MVGRLVGKVAVVTGAASRGEGVGNGMATAITFAREGASVRAGERIGMIRFGSRVDVYLPEGTRPLVAEGQTAVAGETLIADLRATARELTFRVG